MRVWKVGQAQLSPRTLPRLMAILNVTPDSFSDGGQFHAIESALAQARALVAAGADILDIGGESTRPGAAAVTAEEELARVVPVIRELARELTVPISIDTTKAVVARAALAAGATIVNDISGLEFDPEIVPVCRDYAAAVVCNHIQGTPQTMQRQPTYANVVTEVRDYLARRLDSLVNAGIDAERIVLDPGIGFGKTARHNVELLAGTRELQSIGRPVLVGHSRKGFLKHVLGRPVDERVFGTVGVTIALAELGADYVRVHDVAANRDALTAWWVARTGDTTGLDH